MRPEIFRFFLALVLMIGVFVVTNMIFPPIVPEAPAVPESPAAGGVEEDAAPDAEADRGLLAGPAADVAERLVTVETPLYRITFSNYGPVARSILLPAYESFAREGPVELVAPGAEKVLGGTWMVSGGADSVDLTRFAHTVTPERGIQLSESSGPRTLTFRYDHPTGSFSNEIRYTFSPDSYIVEVEGELPALDRAALFVDLGPGLAYNELREADDRRMMAFSANHVDDGIRSRSLGRVNRPELIEGPLRWAAVKSKYFVQAILAGDGTGDGEFLAGIWADPVPEDGRAAMRIGTPVAADGTYAYRAYLGPIDRAHLLSAGDDLEEVNPYGWRFFRPVVRPFVGVILWAIKVLHDKLSLSYGLVLMVIGVLMRVLLWPLNQKAMRSQIKNMSVQPLMEEVKRKYPDDPKKQQQETMKLYKEHGVNPLAGCVPMLIPWPMLIALFFVFQNTIQLRGESFLWLPDLSAPDPFFALPIFLGVSMFLLQYISMKASAGAANPQMKMMMYFLPIFMVVIFWRLASGLNLYYATANLATIPQQILIARERKKAQAAGAPKPRG